MAGTTHHKVLIVGGGTAGITVAASLKRHGPGGIDIAIVEPSDTHYYQPAFTLVGAGVYDLARTRRTTESLVPSHRAVVANLGNDRAHGSAASVRRRSPKKRAVLVRGCRKPMMLATATHQPARLRAADADRRIGPRDQKRTRKAACAGTPDAEAHSTARSWSADLRRAGRSSAVRAGDWRGSWRVHRERASGQRQNGEEYAYPLSQPLTRGRLHPVSGRSVLLRPSRMRGI